MMYSGHTHWVDYSPRNIGREWVTAACGLRVLVVEFSALPTCKTCWIIRIRERLKTAREKLKS